MAVFSETQAVFMGHIRDPEKNLPPEGIEDRRLDIYRELFFNNIKGFLSNSFPVLESLYSKERWNQIAREFFIKHDCQSPYFVDISKEFLTFLQSSYEAQADDPPFLVELAHYEWVELDISIRKETRIQRYWDGERTIGKVCFSELAELLSYQFPVHQIKPSYQPQEAGEPVYLVVARNTQYKVNFTRVNQVTAHMLSLLQQQELTLAQLVDAMSQALPQVDPSVINKQIKASVEMLLSQQILCLAD